MTLEAPVRREGWVTMGYAARVLADSLSPDNVRLTTLEVTFPRVILSEFNTHRVFSRNSASSRAIPVEKMLKRVQEDPFVPIHWGKNQKGMQAEQELSTLEEIVAVASWLQARDHVIIHVNELLTLGVHKQITNRLLEPWLWQTVIVTATEWDNFFGLRRHKDAQPEIRRAADVMWDAVQASEPSPVNYGDWHLPLVEPAEAFDLQVQGIDAVKVCAGRCARVSYLTHDGKRDPKADVELCERLIASGHMSPMEHPARPMMPDDVKLLDLPGDVRPSDFDVTSAFCGNFRGWVQFRKTLPNEANFLARSNA